MQSNEPYGRYGTNAVEIMLQSRLLMAGDRLVARVLAPVPKPPPLPAVPPPVAEALAAERERLLAIR